MAGQMPGARDDAAAPDPVAPDGRLRGRAVYVDRARGSAIALVLFAHAMSAFEGRGTGMPEGTWAVMDALIRSGTPTFFVIFGIAVELVHVPRWQAGETARVRRALLKRALQCYLGYALIALAAIIGGRMAWRGLIPSLALQQAVPLGNVLSFYALACLACLALIPLRNRIGTVGVLLLCLAWWPIAALIDPLVGEDGGFVLLRVFGLGSGMGPSVLHGLALVAAGMVLGEVVKARLRGPVPRRVAIQASVLVGAAVVAATVLVAQHGAGETVRMWRTLSGFRSDNHWGYFVLGFLAAVVVLLLCSLIVEKFGVTRARPPGPFGRSSLLAFTAANIVLNLIAERVWAPNGVAGIAMSAAFVAAVWAAVKIGRLLKARWGGSRVVDDLARAA
ncbi:hypothetical protein P0L94_10295 [Microbacter sp. GSS18]|nr:hypothetical protein P0L94_10295 [Microbacter sp. GSS18]